MGSPEPAWRRYWPAGAWFLVLIGQSSIPTSDLPSDLPPGLDKVAHVLLYLPLGWLLKKAGPGWNGVLAAGMVLAASDECYQAGVSGRHGDWQDWLADLVGVALGAALCIRYRGGRAGKP